MQKWEYCILTSVNIQGGSLKGDDPRLYFMSKEGISEKINLGGLYDHKRPEGWKNAPVEEYMASVIAILGLNGWEMISTGVSVCGPMKVPGISRELPSIGGSHSIYFKRPID